jgi:hypothetical protein
VQRLAPEFFEQLVSEVLQNRRGLSLAARGADDEVVSNQRDAANIEKDDVAGLLLRRKIDNPPRQTERFGTVLSRA